MNIVLHSQPLKEFKHSRKSWLVNQSNTEAEEGRGGDSCWGRERRVSPLSSRGVGWGISLRMMDSSERVCLVWFGRIKTRATKTDPILRLGQSE